jgi:hypothetical protein
MEQGRTLSCAAPVLVDCARRWRYRAVELSGVLAPLGGRSVVVPDPLVPLLFEPVPLVPPDVPPPDVPLPDVPVPPDVPLPDVPLPDVPLPDVPLLPVPVLVPEPLVPLPLLVGRVVGSLLRVPLEEVSVFDPLRVPLPVLVLLSSAVSQPVNANPPKASAAARSNARCFCMINLVVRVPCVKATTPRPPPFYVSERVV